MDLRAWCRAVGHRFDWRPGENGNRGHAVILSGDAETEHMPAIEVRHALILQLRFPIFAAFSASHHQMFGNPEAPYLGNGSG